ncbi:hypothetical protein [Massilia sp. BKSP1R2A-1]|uniref:hypothetical protein n=1 Tax=Massilia sp. BKSP1R2A-1 TaxID=3422595 RepID=UPI003D339B46
MARLEDVTDGEPARETPPAASALGCAFNGLVDLAIYVENSPMKNTAYRLLLAVSLLVAVIGCSDTKSLPGNYKLERWEDGKSYYLHGPSKLFEGQSGGGVIDGVLVRIAWDREVIAAERYAIFRGDPDGWMIIDIKSGKISGPVSNPEFDAIRIKRHLKVKEAREAWEEL